MTPSRDRVLSGMRPTGQLHLGNYLGALENWVKLQDQFDCFYFVANWHVLTTIPGDMQAVPGDNLERGADWLDDGRDRALTLFIQSLVPSTRVHLLFSMATPVTWLERVPTYKEMVERLGIESPSYSLLGYPLLRRDILMYKGTGSR
jgi:tryptophanyl-tRNA synthetase